MTDETLLAHLAQRLGSGWENLATETLAYILRDPKAAEGMYKHARRFCGGLPPVVGYRTQEWAGDQGIPDLVGIGEDATTPLIVEVKFDAALTSSQPVVYLQRLLPFGRPGLLLFLVPTRRVTSVWATILSRCNDAGLPLEVDEPGELGQRAEVAVAVTRWSDLLEDLETSLTPPTEHRRTLAELEQLRGLCDRADREAFRPFTGEFLSGDIGRHLIDLGELMNEAVNGLATEGDAKTKGLRASQGANYFGRYVRIQSWECYLQVHFGHWGRTRSTPMWLLITDSRASSNQELTTALSPLTAVSPSRLLDDNGRPMVPISIPADADRDTVFMAIDGQLREVAALLATCTPPEDGAQVLSSMDEQA